MAYGIIIQSSFPMYTNNEKSQDGNKKGDRIDEKGRSPGMSDISLDNKPDRSKHSDNESKQDHGRHQGKTGYICNSTEQPE